MTSTRSRLTAAAAGTALALGAGGLAVAVGAGAFADTRSPTPSTGASGGTYGAQDEQARGGERGPGRGRHGGPLDGRGALGGLGGPMLHGEIVVGDDQGSGTRQVLVQVGEVTAADGDVVTVRSSDGYTLAWTITDTTRTRASGATGSGTTGSGPTGSGTTGSGTTQVPGGIAVGDPVRVMGTRTGDGTATATALHEQGQPGSPREHRPGRKDGQEGSRGATPGAGPTDADGTEQDTNGTEQPEATGSSLQG